MITSISLSCMVCHILVNVCNAFSYHVIGNNISNDNVVAFMFTDAKRHRNTTNLFLCMITLPTPMLQLAFSIYIFALVLNLLKDLSAHPSTSSGRARFTYRVIAISFTYIIIVAKKHKNSQSLFK